MAAGKGKQFLLLFWKNWIIQKRKICCTITQIVIPIVLALLLLAIRQLVEAEDEKKSTWNDFNVDSLPDGLVPPGDNLTWFLAYTPENDVTRDIMASVASQLNVQDMGYASEKSMVNDLTQENTLGINSLGGIIFTSSFSGSNIADHTKYKIRLSSIQQNCEGLPCTSDSESLIDWQTQFQYATDVLLGPRNPDDKEGGYPGYYTEGFLAVQRAVDRAVMIEHGSTAEDIDEIAFFLQRQPYPEYLSDPFIIILQGQFPLFLMIIYLMTVPCIAKDVVLEKERKLKETMKLMGLQNWLHWAAWFVKYFTFLMIAVIVMTIMFSVDLGKGAVVNNMDWSLLFVFLVIYTIAVIMFTFAISVFFSSANVAAGAAGILFFLSYVPYFFFGFQYYDLSLATKVGSSLLPNVAMAFSCVLIALQEANGVGMQWSNFAEPVNVNDNITLLNMMLILLMDSFICLLIVWYVDAVKPGEFGVPLPWYFPFTKWYWCGSVRSSDEQWSSDINTNPHQHEALPDGVNTGIKIRGLSKVFNARSKDPRIAVDNLDMDMVEGQITALLGHNGAGKTTTMFMLTGFLEPTNGNAVIGGFDIRRNLDKVRENLGLCPQHDVLFDVLTVEEHLQFFGRLKGCENLQQEVDEMIELLHLKDKTHRQARTLSGGMKRKLCVGIALIGGSKFIILDEPTSGMDPEARRQTWDILQKARKGRTMLLTTHFMDEADYLGDRIAIMASGKLVCSGSSLFLKKRYGVGYHMNMVKTDRCDVNTVASTIRQYVPDAGLESDAGAELSFVLPHESSPRFEALFSTLDARKQELGISSWGASVTTMEEVFLKVGDETSSSAQPQELPKIWVGEEEEAGAGHAYNEKYAIPEKSVEGMDNPSFNRDDTNSSSQQVVFKDQRVNIHIPEASNGRTMQSYDVGGAANMQDGSNQFSATAARNSGARLWLQQFWAMFFKRVLNTWRSPVVNIIQLAVPFVFALMGCIIKVTLPEAADYPSLTLKYDNYDDPIGAYKQDANGYSSEINDLADRYKEYLKDEAVDPELVTRGNGYDGLEDYLNDQAEHDLQTYANSYVTAAYFEGNYSTNATDDYTLLAKGAFNNEAIHSPAMALMSVSNALLRYLTGSNGKSIQTTNHPLPLPASYKAEADLSQDLTVAFTIALMIGFGMSFMIATFVVFLIKERAIKSKHCQFTSGVPVATYWLGTYLWDLINFMIPCLAILILFAAFDIEGYITGNNLGVCFLLFLCFGLSVLPFVYLFSFMFDVAASGYIVLLVINIITGIASTLAVFILKIINTESTKKTGDVLEWVFYALFPNFCFSNGLQELYNNYNAKETCDKTMKAVEKSLAELGSTGNEATFEYYCDQLSNFELTNPCCEDNCGDSCTVYFNNDLAWKSPGVGRAIVFMLLQMIVYFAIIFFLESSAAKFLKQKMMSAALRHHTTNEQTVVTSQVVPMNAAAAPVKVEDDDVANEKRRINDTPNDQLREESVILRGLTKYYGDFLAVDELSIGIKHGECFGLLGVNGAGKTTTFKMLTGDETITGGSAYVNGYDVASHIKAVQQQVGYCPQFDALIEKLTVRETLTMYARLRGIKESDISHEVEKLIGKLLLTEYTKKLAGNLSGGNKRKLSTAIALVGNPPIVFLDEPTTGMDPVARRQLWNTLVEVREAGRTIILTSHSMEECEALCTRLVVMVNGQFKCVGASQHLKDKFGEGFALMAKVTPGENNIETQVRTNNMMMFITSTFPQCVLKDAHPGLVLYQISSANTSLAQVFGIIERNKEQLFIEDYSVSQTTLEQVFINFARSQKPPLEDSLGCCPNFCGCFTCCCCQ